MPDFLCQFDSVRLLDSLELYLWIGFDCVRLKFSSTGFNGLCWVYDSFKTKEPHTHKNLGITFLMVKMEYCLWVHWHNGGIDGRVAQDGDHSQELKFWQATSLVR